MRGTGPEGASVYVRCTWRRIIGTEVEDFPAAAMLPEEAAVIGSEARETCEAPSRIEVVSVYVRREAYMAPGLRS